MEIKGNTSMMMRTLVATLALMAAPTLLAAQDITGDVKKGERVFKKCRACHQIGDEAKNKTGPALTGVVGRAAGSSEGYKYSKTLTAAAEGGLVWDAESLDAFLLKPKDYMNGTKMTFAGLRKDADRENVIAYLASFPDT